MAVSPNLLSMIADALKYDPTHALILAFMGHDYSGAEIARVLEAHGLKIVAKEI